MTRPIITLVLFALGVHLLTLQPAKADPQQIISLGSLERIPWAQRDLPDGKIIFAPNLPLLEQGFANRFETVMSDFTAAVEQLPDFLQMDAYQQLVAQVELLVGDYGRFLNRVDDSIAGLDDLIEQSRADAAVLGARIDAVSQRNELPKEQRHRMLAQLSALQSRLVTQTGTLALNQTTLVERQPVFASLHAEMEAYLAQISELGSNANALTGGARQLAAGSADSMPAIPRGQDPVLVLGKALPLYDYAANGPVDFSPQAPQLSAIPEPTGIVLLALAALSVLLARAGRRLV